jgi:hypothetical protein
MKVVEEEDPENARAQVEGPNRIMKICIMRIFEIYISFPHIRSNYQAVSSSATFYNFALINFHYIFTSFGIQCKHKQTSYSIENKSQNFCRINKF